MIATNDGNGDMGRLKYDAINLIARGAKCLGDHNDGGSAYALYELANNLRLLMRGEAAISDWLAVYVGHERDPIDIDKVLPAEDEQ